MAQCAIIRISVCMHVKVPGTGSHTIVWTHKTATHTGRNGQRCSCGYPVVLTPSPARDQSSIKYKKEEVLKLL